MNIPEMRRVPSPSPGGGTNKHQVQQISQQQQQQQQQFILAGSPRTSSHSHFLDTKAKLKQSSAQNSTAKFSRHHKQKDGISASALANFNPNSQALVNSLMQSTISPPSTFAAGVFATAPAGTSPIGIAAPPDHSPQRPFFSYNNNNNNNTIYHYQPQLVHHHQSSSSINLTNSSGNINYLNNSTNRKFINKRTSTDVFNRQAQFYDSHTSTQIQQQLQQQQQPSPAQIQQQQEHQQFLKQNMSQMIRSNNTTSSNNIQGGVQQSLFRISQQPQMNSKSNNLSSNSMHAAHAPVIVRPSSAQGRSLNVSGFPLKYIGKHRASEILRMVDLVDYLLGKGYLSDASDAFCDFIMHTEQTPANKLLVEDTQEAAEQCEREATSLFKLSAKFTSYLLQQSQQQQQQQQQQYQRDQQKAISLLNFQQKLIESVTQRKEQALSRVMLNKFKANYYSNLGVFSVKQCDYSLAISYFQLSLSIFAAFEASQQSQQHAHFGSENQIITTDRNNNNNQEITTAIPPQTKQHQYDDVSIEESQSSTMKGSGAMNHIFESTSNASHRGKQHLGGNPIQECIVLNNLAMVYAMMHDYAAAEKLLLRSVTLSQADIFSTMRKISTRYLRRDTSFLEKLPVLIYAYVYLEAVRIKLERINLTNSTQQSKNPNRKASHTSSTTPPSTPVSAAAALKNQQQKQQQTQAQLQGGNTGKEQSETPKANKQSFMRNALGLCNQFLGADHPLTQRIQILEEKFITASHPETATAAGVQQQENKEEVGVSKAGVESEIQVSENGSNLNSQQVAPSPQIEQILRDLFPYEIDQTKLIAVALHHRITSYEQSQLPEDMYPPQHPLQSVVSSFIPSSGFPSVEQLTRYHHHKSSKNSEWDPAQSVASPQQQQLQPQQKQQQQQQQLFTQATFQAQHGDQQQDIGQNSRKPNEKISQQLVGTHPQQQQQQQSTTSQQKQSQWENQELKKEVSSLKQTLEQVQSEMKAMQLLNPNMKQIELSDALNSSFVALADDPDMNIIDDISQISGTANTNSNKFSFQPNEQLSVAATTQSPSKLKKPQIAADTNDNQNALNSANKPSNFKRQIQPTSVVIPNGNQLNHSNGAKVPSISSSSSTAVTPTQGKIQNGSNPLPRTSIENMNNSSSSKNIQQQQQPAQQMQPAGYPRSQSSKKGATSNFSPRVTNSQTALSSSSQQASAIASTNQQQQQQSNVLAASISSSSASMITRITDCIYRSSRTLDFSLKRLIPTQTTANPAQQTLAIRCGIRYDKPTRQHVIQIGAIDSSTGQLVSEGQTLSLSVFAELLKYVEYEDVLPSTMPVDSISSISDICKFFILPFIGIEKSGGSSAIPSIKVFPRAQGILTEYHKIEFLNAKVLVQINHVEGTMFRISICEADSARKNVRVDLEYDDTSFKGMFTVPQNDQYASECLNSFFECTHASSDTDDAAASLGKEIVHREILFDRMQFLKPARESNALSDDMMDNEESEAGTEGDQSDYDSSTTPTTIQAGGIALPTTTTSSNKLTQEQQRKRYQQQLTHNHQRTGSLSSNSIGAGTNSGSGSGSGGRKSYSTLTATTGVNGNQISTAIAAQQQAEEFFVSSVRAANYENFVEHLSNIIKEIERVFKTFSSHASFDSASQDPAYFKVKVYQGLKKSMLIVCSDLVSGSTFSTQQQQQQSEQPLLKKPSDPQSGVRVQLFNFFESFTGAGQKTKEKGEAILSSQEISRIYGVSYVSGVGGAPSSVSRYLLPLCSYHFNLRVIEKVKDIPQNSSSSSNYNILRLPTVSGGQSMYMLAGRDGFVYPLTFEVHGVKDVFLGVKISLYDSSTVSEECMFLTTNQASWVFENEILKQKFHHFATDSLPLANYFITHIFRNLAVPVLRDALHVENSSSKSKPSLQGAKGFPSSILRLEALLNPASTRAHFMQKQAANE